MLTSSEFKEIRNAVDAPEAYQILDKTADEVIRNEIDLPEDTNELRKRKSASIRLLVKSVYHAICAAPKAVKISSAWLTIYEKLKTILEYFS